MSERFNAEKCADDVFQHGELVSVLGSLVKGEANRLVQELSAATGDKWDWNYVGGRVCLRRLRSSQPPPSQHPEGPAVDREDSRESLAQELREGLRKRGFWAPASGSPASDVITAVFRAIEDRDAKWTNALDDLRGKEEDLSYYRKENLKAEAELAALRTRVKVLEEALRVYARRYESEGGTCWNWTQRVCDSFSGEVDHFDYIGSEQDAPWEIAERALAAVALPVPPAEKRERGK